jgi:DNA-binding beta-propeller fold protein YncE
VGNNTAGTVTPILIATNTALPPIKTGGNPFAIAITPNGKTAYVSLVTAGVIPIRTATNTALPALKIGYSSAIAITP